LTATYGFGETFQFKYPPGTKLKWVSTVEQDVRLNGIFLNQAQIHNKISLQILEEREGSGFLEAQFNLSENKILQGQPVYSLDSQYTSRFWRDPQGRYTIEDQYYMPVARNIPVFPKEDIQPGHIWTAPGEEVHDLRRDYGIDTPMRIPFTAQYEFIGYRDWKGKSLPVLSAQYALRHPTGLQGEGAPVLFEVQSVQVIFWDPELGWPVRVKESYDINLYLASGDVANFNGTAEGIITESIRMDRDKVVEDLDRNIEELGIEDTSAVPTEEGVALVLEGIQFYPDSDQLLPGEEEKLRKIARLLAAYPERDLLVEGHTALAGTREGRKTLSEIRARKVGALLLEWGVRSPQEILYRGWGAEKPLGSNNTEEGRRKNRRVEITILEN